MGEVISGILNNPLYVSILVILISSLIGVYVRSNSRDRCMRDFDEFKVTLEDQSGKIAWGELNVYSSGVELLYSSAHRDDQGHVENSYILYENELATLNAIYRFHHELSPENQLRRTIEIRRTYQPNIFRRTGRALRNAVSTFKDAIVQTTSAVLGHRAAQQPQNLMLSQHQKLTDSGAQLLTVAVGNAYEPILERYIGQYVVLEVLRDGTVEEVYGILKEYSARYIELLNIKMEAPIHVYLKDRIVPGLPPVPIEIGEETIHIVNPLDRTLVIESIHCGEQVRQVDVYVESKRDVEIELSEAERGKPLTLDLSARCLADMIVPRAAGIVRHAGRREKLSLETLLGLDDLSYIPWVRRLVKEGKTLLVHYKDKATGSASSQAGPEGSLSQ